MGMENPLTSTTTGNKRLARADLSSGGFLKTMRSGGVAKMELVNSSLFVDREKFEEAITPPRPQILLDLTPKELNEIMRIAICKGHETEEEGNKFTAFSLSVGSLEEIKNAYIKMRLCQPKARHIICAYSLKGDLEVFHQNNGFIFSK